MQIDTLANADGTWPLPISSEVRRVFWSEDTARTLNGAEVADIREWTPGSLPAGPLATQHLLSLGDQTVLVEPARHLPKPQARVAVYVDNSLSMERHRQAVSEALRDVADAEVWCVREDKPGPCLDLRPETHLFWGGKGLAEQLRALPQINADALIVLTDRGNYEAEVDTTFDHPLPPLWLVHLDGFPGAYPDVLLDAMATGGNVSTVQEALNGVARQAPGSNAWTWHPVDGVGAEDPNAAALAGVFLVRSMGYRSGGPLPAHEVALAAGVVTPWSSIMVPVNSQQQAALLRLSQGGDAFAREITLEATPEPETWALMCLGLAMVLLTWRQPRPHPT